MLVIRKNNSVFPKLEPAWDERQRNICHTGHVPCGTGPLTASLAALYARAPLKERFSGRRIVFVTGRENDGTGLYYYRARYYSPTLQRFISEDPIGFAGGDVNFYAYVGNNPIRYIDPRGLEWFHQEGEEYVVGRRGSIIEPDTPFSRLLEDYVPAMHTLGVNHDGLLDALGVKPGTLADRLLNIPSMPPVYLYSVGEELLNSGKDLLDWLLDDDDNGGGGGGSGGMGGRK